jgi:hypothetical protein
MNIGEHMMDGLLEDVIVAEQESLETVVIMF